MNLESAMVNPPATQWDEDALFTNYKSVSRHQRSPEDEVRFRTLDVLQAQTRSVKSSHSHLDAEYLDASAPASVPKPPPTRPKHPYLFTNENCTISEPLQQLRTVLPLLSEDFWCSDADADVVLSCLSSRTRAGSEALQDRMTQLECDLKTSLQRLERRDEEVARLKDDVAEARQKQRATEAQAKQTAHVLSMRREEARKQLLLEESKTAKAQFQIRTLQAEVDKLKERVHQLLSR